MRKNTKNATPAPTPMTTSVTTVPAAPANEAQTPPVKNQRLTVEEFVLRAIEKLAPPGKQTIHTVFTGFNDGFREYFPGQDPIEEVKKLVEQGKVSFRFCRGGALIGKPGAITRQESPKAVLTKMGLQ